MDRFDAPQKFFPSNPLPPLAIFVSPSVAPTLLLSTSFPAAPHNYRRGT